MADFSEQVGSSSVESSPELTTDRQAREDNSSPADGFASRLGLGFFLLLWILLLGELVLH